MAGERQASPTRGPEPAGSRLGGGGPGAAKPSAPRRAWRTATARQHRAVALLCGLGLVLIVVFAVYAAASGKSQQVEGVVQFSPSATRAQKDGVRSACPTVGRAVLEPTGASKLATARTYPVRYDFTRASAADQAAVYRCVSARPGVIGVSLVRQGD